MDRRFRTLAIRKRREDGDGSGNGDAGGDEAIGRVAFGALLRIGRMPPVGLDSRPSAPNECEGSA
jgi:hypothetical protein